MVAFDMKVEEKQEEEATKKKQNKMKNNCKIEKDCFNRRITHQMKDKHLKKKIKK